MAWVSETGATAIDSSVLTVTVPSGGYAAGAFLVAGVGTSNLPTSVTLSDTRGNVWSADIAAYEQTEGITGKGSAYQFHTVVTTALQAGDSITVTFVSSPVPPARSIGVIECFDDDISGVDVASAHTTEGVQQKDITSGATPSTASPNQLAVGVIALNNSGQTTSPEGGYVSGSKYVTSAGSGNRAIIMQWKYISSIGIQEMVATCSASAYWAATVQTYALGEVGSDRSGLAKVWTGDAWEQKPAKVWNGTDWQPHEMRAWDGADWRKAK